MMQILNKKEVHTGGGVFITYGKLDNGNYFMYSEGEVYEYDFDPEPLQEKASNGDGKAMMDLEFGWVDWNNKELLTLLEEL